MTDSVFEMPQWFVRLTAAIAVVVFVMITIFAYRSEEVKTEVLENNILSVLLKSSPNCLALEEKEVVYANVIDVSKMEALKLRKCFKKDNVFFRLTLSSFEGKEVKAASLIPLNVERLVPVCGSLPEYECVTWEEYALYKEGEKVVPGVLKVEVVRHV
ncbi:MAG TPA: hypothetical protein VFE88_04385 [Candidatus Nanoarchaeia archaeon]|nr:hypothetical protein [Candidatus Nanoarchaeia archaeon]